MNPTCQPSPLRRAQATEGAKNTERWAGGGSWRTDLLWLALGLLLVESWLFHRQAVY